jgi:hypothetical protein
MPPARFERTAPGLGTLTKSFYRLRRAVPILIYLTFYLASTHKNSYLHRGGSFQVSSVVKNPAARSPSCAAPAVSLEGLFMRLVKRLVWSLFETRSSSEISTFIRYLLASRWLGSPGVSSPVRRVASMIAQRCFGPPRYLLKLFEAYAVAFWFFPTRKCNDRYRRESLWHLVAACARSRQGSR